MPVPNADRLLVVEDDADARQVLFEVLTRAGYSVITVDDGQQACDLLEKGLRPRLIIVDWILPKVPGEDVVRYAHEDQNLRHVPIIVITGFEVDLRQMKVDATFKKPVDPPALVECVRRLIDRPTRE